MSATSKTAIVTGGNRGIGAAIVARLEADGYQVATLSRSGGARDLDFQCDVSNAEQVAEIVQKISTSFDGLDLLVLNAGIAANNRIDDADAPEVWRQVMATNLDGAFYCVHAAAAALRSRTGRIVAIGSDLSLKGVPDQIGYCAAKHGLIGMVRALAMAFKADGVTVNAVCPGWTDTGMAADRIREIGLDRAGIDAAFPAGRMVQPEEIAATVAFLTTPEARNITGQLFVVDGGATAGYPA